MRKLSAIVVVLILGVSTFGLVGCESNPEPPPESTTVKKPDVPATNAGDASAAGFEKPNVD